MIDSESVSDADLVREFKQGDELAFDALFDRYRDSVYSLAYRTMGPSGAEDTAQEVFIQVYNSLRRFRGDAAFKTWLFRLTLNVCRDQIRRRSRQPVMRDLPPDLVDSNPSADAGAAAREMRAEIESALLELPEDERSLLELRYIQGFAHREISEMLQCNDSTIRTRIHRAITKLRRRLIPVREEVTDHDVRTN
jgi:RNA polymerase sigma-70 factor (ECF subfamily)